MYLTGIFANNYDRPKYQTEDTCFSKNRRHLPFLLWYIGMGNGNEYIFPQQEWK
jgi:hypothetical protein